VKQNLIWLIIHKCILPTNRASTKWLSFLSTREIHSWTSVSNCTKSSS